MRTDLYDAGSSSTGPTGRPVPGRWAPGRSASGRSLLVEVPELRLGLVLLAVALAVAVGTRSGAGVPLGLAVVTTLAVAASLTLPMRLAVLTGLSAWAFLTGFVVNLGGRLTFHQEDVARLGVLLAATALASLLGSGVVSAIGRAAARTSADVHMGTTRPVGLGDAQHLARHRRDLAHPEEEEAQQLQHGVALGPLEVDVRDHPGAVAGVEQERRQRVGDR
jgi:hypothetical protein